MVIIINKKIMKNNDPKLNVLNDIDDWNDKGVIFDKLGRHDEALEAYDKALEIDPNDVVAWSNKGNALGSLGRTDEALKAFDKALEINPDNEYIWYNKGNDLGSLGRTDEALKAFDKALEINPNSAKAWYNKGNTLGKLGRHDEAIEAYDKALEINPDDVNIWYNKGLSLKKFGRYDEAIEACNKALEIKPNSADAWSNKGNTLSKLGRRDEAFEAYEKALEINPNDAVTWNNKSIALEELGRYEEALEAYDKALEIKPNFADAWYNKANALGNLGRTDEAVKAYNKGLEFIDEVLKIDPENIDALRKKGDILFFNFERNQEACDVYESLIKIEPRDINALHQKGRSLLGLGKYEEALNIFNKILEIDSKNEYAIKSKEHTLNLLSETYLFFDTETTGLPHDWNAPVDNVDNWPRLVQLAWLLYGKDSNIICGGNYIIKPEGFLIPTEASNIHKITTEKAKKEGKELKKVLEEFKTIVENTNYLVAHNISFDEKIVGAEFIRKNLSNNLVDKNKICTKEQTTNFCAIPSPNGYNDYKWPKLSELYYKLFGKEMENAHDAMEDVKATAKCFWELKRKGIL